MTREIEKLEELFRRHLGITRNGRKGREALTSILSVEPLNGQTPVERESNAPINPKLWPALEEPPITLLPSAGYFNAARIPTSADIWMIVVGDLPVAKFESFVLEVCHAQSAGRSFRPLFILNDDLHIETLRRFGLSFEILADPDFVAISHCEQLERYARKWGCTLRIVIGDGAAGRSTNSETLLPPPVRRAAGKRVRVPELRELGNVQL